MSGGQVASGMETQKQLSEFLYAELLHSLGIYNAASDKLVALREDLKDVQSGPEDAARWQLNEAAKSALHCNSHLRDQLHHSADLDGKPTTRGQPSPFPAAEQRAYPTVSLLRSIADFYEDAIAALRLHLEKPKRGKKANGPPGHVLGYRLAFIHDPQRRREELSERERIALIEGKIVRNQSRLAEVKKQLPLTEMSNRGEPNDTERTERFEAILGGDANANHSLLLTIIQAMSEAHMWMHQAEHIQSKSFGKMLLGLPETYARSQRMLRYSLVLNTFVYMAAESAPWIFAEDERERDYVISNYDDCVRTLAPTYCIWISAQLSLLALHRRAFTHWTMGKREWAYRDFHKLVRLLRGLREPAERRGLRVPGTKTFIEGITGMAELHIGRIYRGQHAHKMALRYFERASHHLEGWEEHGEIGALVKSSHWRVNLLVNEGEANYQLGRIKRSILCYARAWRAYLLLVEAETHATANVDVVDSFTEWLAQFVDDPDLNRWELRSRIAPLVDQFGTLRTPPHLRSLAADIVMRMGHLLFVLKLPPKQKSQEEEEEPRTKPPNGKHDLAMRCMSKAAFLDPTNTMTATDLLKIEYQTEAEVERPDEGSKGPPNVSLAGQWPGVSGGFEEAAQVTEYILQSWLNEVDEGRPEYPRAPDKRVALDLLRSFLAHTDSSNMKLAQVYRYLMQERRDDGGGEEGDYSLDFVCMRRYSSFFPFLPRPSAFRAPGGGYFVRVREPKGDPFGIAVDPGPDFIENLYRCGFALADIQMIVITHDHADHIASLDALLALMYNRGRLTTDRFSRKKGRRLAIVGNESVCKRYDFFNEEEYDFIEDDEEKARKDAVRVISFEDIHEITTVEDPVERMAAIEREEIVLDPKTLQIEPVKTWGHQDATGIISQGFLLRIGPDSDRSSILFTGDTGVPPELPLEPDPERERRRDLDAKGEKGLREAVEEADVIVAHLSSVPLVELRAIAGLSTGPEDPKPQLVSDYTELWEKAVDGASKRSKDEDLKAGLTEADFLLKQIQFGFRVKNPEKRKKPVSPFDPRQKESQGRQHLYLRGLLDIAEVMASSNRDRGQLLLLGELREELGTFRTSIATAVSDAFFKDVNGTANLHALTADIGLRVRLTNSEEMEAATLDVLCTTCDLDNDLVSKEKFHAPADISEVCVKGEDEGVFYNCWLHNPRMRDEYLWVEAVERYDVFGE
jgi:tetratricopeptide (TPR) repeat protein